MIYNIGGGLFKVVKFINNVWVIKDNLFFLLFFFQMICEEFGINWKEMYQVFNMGQCLEVYFLESEVQVVVDIVKQFNIDV